MNSRHEPGDSKSSPAAPLVIGEERVSSEDIEVSVYHIDAGTGHHVCEGVMAAYAPVSRRMTFMGAEGCEGSLAMLIANRSGSVSIQNL
jgi:hypothetical protein